MGIGEPLDNFDNVLRFLELVNSQEGMNISMRHISLSTCGLVPKIDELAKRKLQISLAISLHGPNDQVRDKIMPVNKAYPMEELLAACRRYYEATSRRIHFEYAMIDGVNDTPEAARELLRRMKGLPAHFNLIPLNHVEESPLKPSSKAAVAAFQKILEDGGITATVRRTLGGDIDASCGQLRRKHQKSQG
jgi:23S rRNA (adenine2503-C2)-methyltransferase